MIRKKAGAPELTWRTMLRLTPKYGDKVDILAAREAIPSASVCRRLIMERIDEIERERGPIL